MDRVVLLQPICGVSGSFAVKLVAALRAAGSKAKPKGGWFYSTLHPHRDFIVGGARSTTLWCPNSPSNCLVTRHKIILE
jgi:hypothetical protein